MRSACCSTPTALDPAGLTTLDAWIPDLEGRLLAYQLSAGGDEHSVLHVLDVTTGDDVEPPIDRCRYSDVAWLPGRRGALLRPHGRPRRGAAGRAGVPPPHLAPPGRRPDRHRRARRRPRPVPARDPHNLLRRRRLRTTAAGCWSPATSAPPAATACGSPTCTAGPGTARSPGAHPGRRRAVRRLGGPRRPALPAHHRRRPPLPARRRRPRRPPAASTGASWSPRTPTPCWRASTGCSPPAPPTPPTACSCSPAAGTRSASWRCTRVDGAPRGTVPLPGLGALAGRHRGRPGHPRAARAGSGSAGPTSSRRRRCAASTSADRRDRPRARPRPGAVPVPPVRTEQREFTSADGTTVRMFVVVPAAARTAARPPCSPATAASASIPTPPTARPRWPGSAPAASTRWLAARRRRGGRGLAPRRATATTSRTSSTTSTPPRRHLVDAGTTTPDQLAILGGSNGGLLVGAALTQRPELLPGGGLLRAAAGHGPLRAVLASAAPGTTSTAPPTTRRSWAGCSSYSPTTTCGTAPSTRRCCSPSSTPTPASTRCTPARCAPPCSTPPPATRRPARSCCAARPTSATAARSVTRAVALGVDQLSFLAAHTGLDARP